METLAPSPRKQVCKYRRGPDSWWYLAEYDGNPVERKASHSGFESKQAVLRNNAAVDNMSNMETEVVFL